MTVFQVFDDPSWVLGLVEGVRPVSRLVPEGSVHWPEPLDSLVATTVPNAVAQAKRGAMQTTNV